MPVVTKAELRLAQERQPPFGDYLCIETSEVFHVHGTSGTTGRPTAFGISRRDWQAIANAHARAMWAMGIRPSDTVFIGSFFSLYMGSWGASIGAERLGASVFPFGAGTPGQTERAVAWMRQMRPTCFYGTPSYAIHLAEVACSAGVDPRIMGIGPVPAIRALLTRQELELSDIDLIELNEAFAAQVIACDRDLQFDRERLNVNGGAIALGHPIGPTDARIMRTFLPG